MGFHSRSSLVTLLCLVYLVRSEAFGVYSQISLCKTGFIHYQGKCVKCPENKYWVMKQGNALCQRCTEACSGLRHLKEVRPCTDTSNRECHCDVGFFCVSPVQYTCRRCIPCPAGTFASTTSRNLKCRPHTDCYSLGKTVVAKGNSTHDHVCGLTSTPSTEAPRDVIVTTVPSEA